MTPALHGEQPADPAIVAGGDLHGGIMTAAVGRLRPGDPAPSVLEGLARLACAADAPVLAADAEALARRVAEGRFFVACVGQFKRGKSTLVNALVGTPILPSGVLPVTSVVTVVRHGAERTARALLPAGWEAIDSADPASLAAYVGEAGNPANVRGVRAVEVFVPHPLLRSGLCLVDTPGLGSTSRAAGEATREFVPHVDAVLAVVGADPPLAGEELELVAAIARDEVPLLVVLNKADRVAAEEREEAVRFARQELSRRLGREVGCIPQVSAAEVLGRGGPTRDWEELTSRLTALAGSGEAGLVRAAAERGAGRIGGQLAGRLREQREALTRPLAASVERLERLRLAVAEAERSAADLAPLLAAEEGRCRERLAARRERFVAAALPAALGELTATGAAPAADAAGPERSAAQRARAIARRRLLGFRAELHPEAERLYLAAAARQVELANGILVRLAANPDLDSLPWALPAETGFREAGHFAFNDLLRLAAPPLATRLGALAPGFAQRLAARHARAYLGRLLEVNSARIVNDFQEQLVESRRQLEGDLAAQLHEIAAAAARALERAVAAHTAGADALREETRRIDQLEEALARLSPPGRDAAGRAEPLRAGGHDSSRGGATHGDR